MFEAKESPAAWLLREHEMTRQDAVNFILHGIEESDNAAG